MRFWHGLAIGLVAAFATYQSGYVNGLRDCPANAEAEAAHQAAIDRDVSAMLAEPTGRELVCEEIFDAVIRELDTESRDDQEMRVSGE